MTDLAQDSGPSEMHAAKRLSRVGELFVEIRDLLFGCSHELAKAGGENWHKAEVLFKLAKNADVLRESVASLLTDEGRSGQELPPLHRDADAFPTPRKGDSKPVAIWASRQVRKNKDDYPKYSVRGDLLVKTGLSRDARNEYEHVVPKKDFDAIVSILTEFSTSKKQFAVEEVQARLACPSYQTYTVLALLKVRGMLLVPKRGLYGVNAVRSFVADAASLWEELRSS